MLGVTNGDVVGSALIVKVTVESDVDCANVVDSKGTEFS